MMNTKNGLIACMLFMFVSHALCALPESSGRGHLTSLRYGNRQGFTRMTIGLEGNVTVSADKHGNLVKLVMGNTSVKSSYDGARLRFSFGPVDVVRVDQMKGDSATVSIQLRADARFTIHREEKMSLLFVDFYTGSAEKTDPPANHSDGKKFVALIPLTAKQPIENDSVKATVVHSGYPDQVKNTQSFPVRERKASSWLKLTTALIAVIVAALGTWTILNFLRGHPAGKQGEKAILAVKQEPVARPAIQSAKSIAPTRARPIVSEQPYEEAPSYSTLDLESSTLALAKRYGRGRGELDLSFNLQAHQTRQWTQFVDKLRQSSDAQQINVARKFGVGRGEVDLAVRMHHLKPKSTTGMEKV